MKHKYLFVCLFIITLVVACDTESENPLIVIDETKPEQAHPGDNITINGHNFGEDPSLLQLSIGGLTAKIKNITMQSIETTVPRAASSGLIELTKEGETVESSFQLLETPSNLTGTVDGMEWEMRSGRTLEASGNQLEIFLYSKDWAKTFDPCAINSWKHGYVYFSIPMEAGSYTIPLNSQFIKLQGFSFCITTLGENAQYKGHCLGEGNAKVEIAKINEYFIIGSLNAEGANGSVSGDFVVNICN